MVVSTPSAPIEQKCQHCSANVESSAKFCGECGASAQVAVSTSRIPAQLAFAQPHQLATAPPAGPRPTIHMVTPPVVRPLQQAPRFARPQPTKQRVSQEVKEEVGKLVMLLARERLFLYMHCIIFLCVNLFGFSLAMKCYNEFNGDEVTRVVLSMTPLMFINTIGLACLSPIKGTKKEIARLKEKMRLLRHKIEYQNLF